MLRTDLIAAFLARAASLSVLAILRFALLRAAAIFPLYLRMIRPRLRRCARLRTASLSRPSASSSSVIFIPERTMSYTSLESLCNFLGRPDLKAASSPAAAAALILEADIPSTPSASGSRSPADTTLIEFSVKSLPLYLFNRVSNSLTRSAPTTRITSVNFFCSSCITCMIVFAFDFCIIEPNAARANIYLSSYESGFFLASCECVRYTIGTALFAFAVEATLLASFSCPMVGGFILPQLTTTVLLVASTSLGLSSIVFLTNSLFEALSEDFFFILDFSILTSCVVGLPRSILQLLISVFI